MEEEPIILCADNIFHESCLFIVDSVFPLEAMQWVQIRRVVYVSTTRFTSTTGCKFLWTAAGSNSRAALRARNVSEIHNDGLMICM